ncbi:MlaD family protein [Acidovorax sp. A1169]|uniref:MlaD family protein n=1 Tax=Acidovorax sp. A1169 TaxID=3059524 RepID=UPI002737871A|nr:MlaD family protein [Acidovorax sp. A1169]MDP4076382.1 MlaD family protein [Acidovorax sp. A1169]
MNYTLVGAFVILLGAVLVSGVLWIASGGTFQKKYDQYMAIEDESVAGLNLNAPVKYNGVEVGKVSSIYLDPENPERVRLMFLIERGTPIKTDTVAVLKTQGLTGIAYVELGGGSRDAPPLKAKMLEAYPVIRTKPSLSARLENVLTTVLVKLDRTSTNIDSLLSDENRHALKGALADIATVSHTIAARKDVIDAGIVSASRTAENTARATAQLGPIIVRIGRAADSVEAMGNDISLAGRTTAKAVGSVGSDAQRFAADTLPEIQRLLGELNDLSISLRRLSDQTARDPGGLLRGHSPIPDGPGETMPKQLAP